MSDVASTPTLRVRINHGRTQKEGWHYDSTVELTAPLEMSEAERIQLLQDWLEIARQLGQHERQVRNAQDRHEKEQNRDG